MLSRIQMLKIRSNDCIQKLVHQYPHYNRLLLIATSTSTSTSTSQQQQSVVTNHNHHNNSALLFSSNNNNNNTSLYPELANRKLYNNVPYKIGEERFIMRSNLRTITDPITTRELKTHHYSRQYRRLLSWTPHPVFAKGDLPPPTYPEFVKRGLPVQIEPEFYVPRVERSEKRKLYNVSYIMGEERLMRSDRTDPTRELNFTAAIWRKHKSPYRKLRHVVNILGSSPVQRLAFPDLFISATVASILTYYNVYMAPHDLGVTNIQMHTFAGVTTAIGLLAGFRLNASYGRYEECRIFWGETINTSRDLARNTLMFMKNKNQQERMLKLIRAFPICYNFMVNRKGGHHNLSSNHPLFNDKIQAEFQIELLDIYINDKDHSDLKRLCEVKYNGGNVGVEALTLMGECIAGSIGTVEGIYVTEMDNQVQRLCSAFGASERVLKTPLPTSFTRHTSRLLFIWDCLLPFAMYPMMGPWLTIPASVLTSFAVLGIDDVGVQMEEPFDILPMRQYCEGIHDAVNQMEKNYTTYKF